MTTTIDRCAQAIAGVRDGYQASVSSGDGNWYVIGQGEVKSPPFETHDECQHWIDCQAARSCIEALLPVSDAVVEASILVPGHPVGSARFAAEFTAAITHIAKEG